MSIPADILLAAAVLLPLAGAMLISVTGSNPNLREAVTLATAVGLIGLVVAIVAAVAAGGQPRITVIGVLPGAAIAFRPNRSVACSRWSPASCGW